MKKRGKLEIINDILLLVQKNNKIKTTPLLRKSNLSTARFKEYYADMLKKKFIQEIETKKSKEVIITNQGLKFLEKYQRIIEFIDEFEL